jgi:hypothetical protein
MTPFVRALRGVVPVVVALVALAGVGLWALSRSAPHTAGLSVTHTVAQKERGDLAFRVKVTIANPDGRLESGMPADAAIATE